METKPETVRDVTAPALAAVMAVPPPKSRLAEHEALLHA